MNVQMQQADVITVYLNANMADEVYVWFFLSQHTDTFIWAHNYTGLEASIHEPVLLDFPYELVGALIQSWCAHD